MTKLISTTTDRKTSRTVYQNTFPDERSGCYTEAEEMISELQVSVDAEDPLIAAVDVGSTSVVAYLMNGTSGLLLGTRSILNPQRQFGADVVSRCSYAIENGGRALSNSIRSAVNILLRELTKQYGRNPEEIVRLVMVGNSCMHHLFLGISPETLVLAPYVPKVTQALRMKASECEIHVHPAAQLWWLPNIGGFVGADTVGCLIATEMDTTDKLTLLVDIGTNGELVLGNRDGLTACSTASGPAFEGARITCGMRGHTGAINHVYLDNEEMKYHVIGDEEPVGICGSGLLDAVSCLIQLGLVDKTGKMQETYHFTDRVFLNQKDIRELQLAKAAIAAGIRILCKCRGTVINDIERVLIAGAFGTSFNPSSACAIGILPPEMENRAEFIGNAAGKGAMLAALNVKQFERGIRLAADTRFLELVSDSEFQDIYMDELGFPDL